LADGLRPGPLEDGKGREGKGRELKGKQGRERGERARLGYLSRAPEFLDTPMNATRPRRYWNSHAMGDHTVFPAIRQM